MKAAELEALGRRAAACPRWRWMPGMLARGKTPDIDNAYGRVNEEWSGSMVPHELASPWPDLSDPATLGCLLHLVREVTGEQSSSPSWYPGGKHDYPHWAWYSDSCYGKLCEGATEAECLVKVLEYKQ